MARPPKGAVNPRVSVEDVMGLLSGEYGPFEWTPRYEPALELVYTVLSQHTSDINSKRAFDSLMATFGSLEEVAKGDVDLIAHSINVGGLARIKAPRIKAVLLAIQERRGDLDLHFLKELPLLEAKAWLRELPGVGPKTAAIVLCFALGMPAMPVDTHIYRVCQRLGVIGPKVSADKAHDILEEKVDPDEVFNFHVSYINHGRQVCRAQRPLCPECVVGALCPSRKKFMSKADLAALAEQEVQTPAGTAGAPMPHVPQPETQ